MTERQQRLSTTALFSVAVSVVGLAVTLAVGIARIGAIYGAVSNEHQQIFREIQQLAERKCP
jgi:hypothetical protein